MKPHEILLLLKEAPKHWPGVIPDADLYDPTWRLALADILKSVNAGQAAIHELIGRMLLLEHPIKAFTAAAPELAQGLPSGSLVEPTLLQSLKAGSPVGIESRSITVPGMGNTWCTVSHYNDDRNPYDASWAQPGETYKLWMEEVEMDVRAGMTDRTLSLLKPYADADPNDVLLVPVNAMLGNIHQGLIAALGDLRSLHI